MGKLPTCLWISEDFPCLLVHSDESDRVNEGKQDGGESDGALSAVDVDHARVALCGTVELDDAFDAEAFHKLKHSIIVLTS